MHELVLLRHPLGLKVLLEDGAKGRDQGRKWNLGFGELIYGENTNESEVLADAGASNHVSEEDR